MNSDKMFFYVCILYLNSRDVCKSFNKVIFVHSPGTVLRYWKRQKCECPSITFHHGQRVEILVLHEGKKKLHRCFSQ